MLKRTAVISVVLALVASFAMAHSGHEKKILGTVKALHENELTVTATDGDVVTVTLADTTKIFKGDAEGTRDDLVEGTRVMIEMDDHGKAVESIRVGVKPKDH